MSGKPSSEFLVLVAGRKRRDPRIIHQSRDSAIAEAVRLRELPDNLDRAVHIVEITATLPPVVPGRELRELRE